MASKKTEQRLMAKELFEASHGRISLKHLAREVGVSLTSIQKWKKEDCWVNSSLILAEEEEEKLDEAGRIRALKREMHKNSKEDLIELHMRIAFADITDFIEFSLVDEPILLKGEPVVVLNEKGENTVLSKKVNRVTLKDSSRVDGKIIREVSDSPSGAKIKLEDRQKSLDFLANYFGLNPMDKHRIEYDNKRLEFQEKKMELSDGKDNELLQAWLEGILEGRGSE